MLTANDLLFSPTRDGIPSSDDNFTAGDLIAAQDAIEWEAAETIPYFASHCTGDMGYIKQPVFACRTCLNDAGVCAGCSLGCHAEHELVELFTRRNFKCDCGTERMGAGSFCSLSRRDDAKPNRENKYSKNFRGEFCVCGVPYDPHTETDAMYQCLICEDWLHHFCLFGSHSDAEKSPLGTDDFDMLICDSCVRSDSQLRQILDRWAGVEGKGVMLIDEKDVVLGRIAVPSERQDGARSGTEDVEDGDLSSGEEPPRPTNLISADDGVPIALPIPSTSSTSSRVVEKRKAETEDPSSSFSDTDPSTTPSHKEEEPLAKKSRHTHIGSDSSSGTSSLKSSWSSTTSSSTASGSQTSSTSSNHATATTSSTESQLDEPELIECSAPPLFESGTSHLARLQNLEKTEGKRVRLNIYLEDGWMERWCRCRECLSYLHRYPYFLEEEEIYNPPDDPDAHKSTLELGMEALSKMPREQAVEGAAAFAGMSERLKTFLRPHALAGETITKDMVDRFFAEERERQQRP